MLTLPATVTQHEVADVLRLLEQAAAQGRAGDAVVVDGSALTRFDSSAIALLLACRRQLRPGQRLVLQAMPQKLIELAGLYGVEGLLFAAGDPVAADTSR